MGKKGMGMASVHSHFLKSRTASRMAARCAMSWCVARLQSGISIADDAVEGAERDARKWQLRLRNGLLVPVARNRIHQVRARGWLIANRP
jgi:hypothetical protein